MLMEYSYKVRALVCSVPHTSWSVFLLPSNFRFLWVSLHKLLHDEMVYSMAISSTHCIPTS